MNTSMDAALLASAWATGLLGSTHCVGMCGGISTALSFALPADKRQGASLFGYQLAYNLGRILTYTVLGIVVGTLAHGILAGWAASPWPRAFAGGFMVVMGLYLAGWWNGLQHIEGLGGGIWKSLAPLRTKILPVNHPLKAVAAGAVWGFLPCGLVYSALTLALARADTVASGGVMLAFGLGTLPTLLLTGTLAGKLRHYLQMKNVRQLAGLLVIALGVWTVFLALSHNHHHEGASMPSDAASMEMGGEHAMHHHHQ
ncbi:MAG: sulfite exporter TauE/SafE family protein [bacterium]|nr:sulfite exporter TauE/SafE family protein [bacterium]